MEIDCGPLPLPLLDVCGNDESDIDWPIRFSSQLFTGSSFKFRRNKPDAKPPNNAIGWLVNSFIMGDSSSMPH